MKAKVIKTEAEHQAALAYLAHLMDQPSPDEAELELWSLLVENYEETRFPIAQPDPIEAILFRLDQSGSKPRDLLPYLGTKSRVSEVLSRRRPLSLAMIRSLHQGLNIPASVLIEAPRLKRKRTARKTSALPAKT